MLQQRADNSVGVSLRKVRPSIVDAGYRRAHTPWMGFHAMPRRALSTRVPILGQANRLRTSVPRVRPALSMMRRRLSHLIQPASPGGLSSAFIALDTTAWQRAVCTLQTPAFRTALIAGLSLAWIGTATFAIFADTPTPHPARGQTHTPVDSAVEPGQTAVSTGNAHSTSDAAPFSPAQIQVSDEFLRNYVKIAAELDRQSGGDEVPVPPQPASPMSHCPTCTDALLPVPEESLDAPQATAEEPLASLPTTAGEEPAPEPQTNSDQPVSPPTNQPPAEPPPAGPPPADTSGEAAGPAG